jgi:hypothetical protein
MMQSKLISNALYRLLSLDLSQMSYSEGNMINGVGKPLELTMVAN